MIFAGASFTIKFVINEFKRKEKRKNAEESEERKRERDFYASTRVNHGQRKRGSTVFNEDHYHPIFIRVRHPER